MTGVSATLADPTPKETDSERSLILATQRGDGEAFERLVRTHAALIYGIARQIAPGSDADDLFQDLVVHLMDKIGTFKGQSAFRTWLRTTARNFALNWVRGRRPVVALDDAECVQAEAIWHQIERREMARSLEEALALLPERTQRAVWLRFWLQLSYAEVAECLGTNADAARMCVHRALLALEQDARLRGWRPASE